MPSTIMWFLIVFSLIQNRSQRKCCILSNWYQNEAASFQTGVQFNNSSSFSVWKYNEYNFLSPCFCPHQILEWPKAVQIKKTELSQHHKCHELLH